MPILDNEKSIRFTVKELLLIKNAVNDILSAIQDEDLPVIPPEIEEGKKAYKDILFKISKKLPSNYSEV